MGSGSGKGHGGALKKRGVAGAAKNVSLIASFALEGEFHLSRKTKKSWRKSKVADGLLGFVVHYSKPSYQEVAMHPWRFPSSLYSQG